MKVRWHEDVSPVRAGFKNCSAWVPPRASMRAVAAFEAQRSTRRLFGVDIDRRRSGQLIRSKLKGGGKPECCRREREGYENGTHQ